MFRCGETDERASRSPYVFEGRRRRPYIGDFPHWWTAAARDRAKEIKREVDQGLDPLSVRDERRTAPTMRRRRAGARPLAADRSRARERTPGAALPSPGAAPSALPQ